MKCKPMALIDFWREQFYAESEKGLGSINNNLYGLCPGDSGG